MSKSNNADTSTAPGNITHTDNDSPKKPAEKPTAPNPDVDGGNGPVNS